MGEEKGKWGLLDSVGREILPPSLAFDTVHAFHEGRALVRQGYRYGYVDKSGRLVIPLRYWQADEFHNGKAPARTLFRRGLLLPDGTWFRSAVAAEWLLLRATTAVPTAAATTTCRAEPGRAGPGSRTPRRDSIRVTARAGCLRRPRGLR